MKDLTNSQIDRQNILNNPQAVENIQKHLGIMGMFFEEEYYFTTQQVSEFYLIDRSTINRYLSQNEEEFTSNGYRTLKGNALQKFKDQFGGMLQDGVKAPQLGVFNFRAFLNLGMLLVESEKAKAIRKVLLDIVIDTLNKKLGGSSKYINQRDEDFFYSILKEPHYRNQFDSSLKNYVETGDINYARCIDEIYKAIFQENAMEYKVILSLHEKENERATMYAEILKLISSFETGLAYEIEKKYVVLGRKLTILELDELISTYSSLPLYVPLIEDARRKMASRDYAFRDITHDRLKPYIQCLAIEDYERFLGDKSKELFERFEENIDLFKRLSAR